MGIWDKLFRKSKETPSLGGLISRLQEDKIKVTDKYSCFITADNLVELLDNWDRYSSNGKKFLVNTMMEWSIYQEIILSLKGKGNIPTLIGSYAFIVMGEDICGKDLITIINSGQFDKVRISEIIASYSIDFGKSLLGRLENYPVDTKAMILFALSDMNFPDISSYIAKNLTNFSGYNLISLIEILSDSADKSVIPYLVDLLDKYDYAVTVAIINCLGAIGDSSVIEVLQRYVLDPQWHISVAAKYSIKQLGGDIGGNC